MEWEGIVKAQDAELALLQPFIERMIPPNPALRTYALLLAAGFRTGNLKTAITEEALDLLGLGKVGQGEVYDALEDLGGSLGNTVVLRGAPNAKMAAGDVHVPEKFGRNLHGRYNTMRGRPTKTIPTLTVADVSNIHADPILVEVLEEAGDRGPQLLLRIIPRLKKLGHELLLFDGELSSKEVTSQTTTLGMSFIGRLRSNTLLAGRLKPLMTEENRLYSMKMFDLEWGGEVVVFGFLRREKHFCYISNLNAPAEELKELFGRKWRLENFFRDADFIDQFPGCNPAKARAHAFISFTLGRLTGAFRATAKTIRLLFRAVKGATISRGRLTVEFHALPKRLVEKLWSYIAYLREKLEVDASLHFIPASSETGR